MSWIKRIENKIQNEKEKIENSKENYNRNEITKKELISINEHTEKLIKVINLRLRMLRGEVAKKKRLAKEKNNKNRSTKENERTYFVWRKKHENI